MSFGVLPRVVTCGFGQTESMQFAVFVLFPCSDGVLRIFSRSPDRQSGAEEQQAFLDSVANANIPSQIGDVKTADLPGPEALLNVGKCLSIVSSVW